MLSHLLVLMYCSRDERGPEHSIFVGDRGPEVNDYVFVELLQNRFPS